MKITFLGLLLYSLLFMSCGVEESTSGIKVVSINPTAREPLKEVFASVKVVPLEQNEDALFGLLFSMVRLHNNLIYIVPRSYSREKILVYNLDGRLVKTVDNFGPGPEQLKKVLSFEIVGDEHIEMLSVSGHLLTRYNLKSDSIEWSKKYLGNSPRQFLKRDNEGGYFFSRGVTEADYLDPLYWLHTVDDELQESEEYFRGRPMRPNATRMPLLYHTMQRLGGEVRFLPPYSDTIFTLMDNEEVPVYKLDFGKFKKYNSLDVDRKKVDDVFFNKNGVRAINFFETKDKLILSYSFKNIAMTVFDKHDKTISTTEISKSLLLDNSFLLTPFYADDNMVACTFRSNNMTARDFAREYFDDDQIEGEVKGYDSEEEIPEVVIFKFH